MSVFVELLRKANLKLVASATPRGVVISQLRLPGSLLWHGLVINVEKTKQNTKSKCQKSFETLNCFSLRHIDPLPDASWHSCLKTETAANLLNCYLP